MYTLHHAPCEQVFPTIGDNSLHGIFTDPPYNVSAKDIIGDEKSFGNLINHKDITRDLGDWDKGFDPAYLIAEAERTLVPGGWLVICSGDMTFPAYHTLIKESTWLHYRATVSWTKINPTPSIRKRSVVSAVEFIVMATRGDLPIKTNQRENPRVISVDKAQEWALGNSPSPLLDWIDDLPKSTRIPAVAWHWLGQNAMKNWFSGTTCTGKERLYWHDADGEIVPCVNPQKCPICYKERSTASRTTHPTQKPRYVWKWCYDRMLRPKMTIYDPYAGLATSGVASLPYGVDWIGSEIDGTYYRVGQLALDGRWNVPNEQDMLFDMNELL